MWFRSLVGFAEGGDPDKVRSQLSLSEDGVLTSKSNNVRIACGKLTTPSLGELRRETELVQLPGRLVVSEVVGNVQELHRTAEVGTFFQVASQFNLLEMASPRAVPEDGVECYGSDHTQGPACAISCGGGTIYRNYYAPVHLHNRDPTKQQIGQSRDLQIDCLLDMGKALGNDNSSIWKMQNGYCMATRRGLETIQTRLTSSTEEDRDALRQLLRIGIQSDTQVTLPDRGKSAPHKLHQDHTVTQAYCSALPVAYAIAEACDTDLWEEFACLILEASYEAVMHAAVLNASRTGNRQVYLTMIGGGVFGNRPSWIINAMKRAFQKFADTELQVAIVSYRRSDPNVRELVSTWQDSY